MKIGTLEYNNVRNESPISQYCSGCSNFLVILSRLYQFPSNSCNVSQFKETRLLLCEYRVSRCVTAVFRALEWSRMNTTIKHKRGGFLGIFEQFKHFFKTFHENTVRLNNFGD